MRYTHFPTPWDEHSSSRAGTVLYGFNQLLTTLLFAHATGASCILLPNTTTFANNPKLFINSPLI